MITYLCEWIMKSVLDEGKEVKIANFGTFYRYHVKPRRTWDPQREEIIEKTTGYYKLKFRPSGTKGKRYENQ